MKKCQECEDDRLDRWCVSDRAQKLCRSNLVAFVEPIRFDRVLAPSPPSSCPRISKPGSQSTKVTSVKRRGREGIVKTIRSQAISGRRVIRKSRVRLVRQAEIEVGVFICESGAKGTGPTENVGADKISHHSNVKLFQKEGFEKSAFFGLYSWLKEL